MCGRYASTRSAPDLSALFEALDETPGGAVGRFNLAPTDPAPVVRVSRRAAKSVASAPAPLPGAAGRNRGAPAPDKAAGSRVLSVGRWGLVPHWARDVRVGARMINARAETVASAKTYAEPFANRRALVPADGWYEWLRDETGKHPYFMTPADGSVLALAGLWSRWGTDGLLTFSIVTTPAVGPFAAVHDRMPLLLEPGRWDGWLAGDSLAGDAGQAAEALLAPPAPEFLAGLEIRPVGPAVGNVRNDGPELVKRVDTPATPAAAQTLF